MSLRHAGAAARRGRGAGTREGVGLILVLAVVTGVLATARLPREVSTGIKSAICEVAQETGCAPPRGSGQAAAGPAAGPPARKAGPAGVPAIADPAARREPGPPEPPDAETARERLAELKVATEGSEDGYDRDEFPHWSDQDDNCNTREAVLKRDGTGVKTAGDC
jgi:hypothetical protein